MTAAAPSESLTLDSLPTDLLDALRAGVLVNVNRSAIVDAAERVIEFRADDGRVWRSAVTPGGGGSSDAVAGGRRQTGPWSSASDNNASSTTASASPPSTSNALLQRGKNAVTQPLVVEEVNREEWVQMHVVQTIALRPITLPALRKALRELWQQRFRTSEQGEDGREAATTSVDAIDEEVQRAVKQYAFVVNSRSEDLDLNASGLRLVQLDRYDNASQKRQAANRLAPRMQREGLPILEDLVRHMDREVYLDLFSKGGIMSGMKGESEGVAVEPGDAQREEERGNLVDKTLHHVDEAASEGGRPQAGSGGNKRRRIERMEDLQLDFDSSDLTSQSLLALASPEVIVEVEELASERVAREKQKMAPSPLLVAPLAQLDDAQKRYDRLQHVFDSIDAALRKHEVVCAQLNVTLHETMHSGDGSTSSSTLTQEVLQWAQKQAAMRSVLVDLWTTLRVELSFLRREIGDVTLLRELLLGAEKAK